jgi:cyclase
MPNRKATCILSASVLAVAIAAVVIAALSVVAQAPAGATAGGPQPAQANPHESLAPLNAPKNSIYLASGSTGSNNGVIIGSDGVIVVDTGITPDSEKAELAQIATVTSKPVTTAILTHSDGDHVNGLSALPAGITIIAQENCKKEMEPAASAPQRGSAPAVAIPLPTKTIGTKDAMTIGSVRFEFLHVAPAHTSGDLIVFLPDEKLVFTGDIITDNSPYPLIHLEKNGSSEGWIETVTAIAALDADKFVTGHGGVHTKTEIEQRLSAVKERRAQIQSLVAQGKPLDEIKQQLGETAPPAGGRGPRFPSFTDVVYQELTKKN